MSPEIYKAESPDLMHVRVASPVIICVTSIACDILGATERRDRLGGPIDKIVVT